MGIKDGRKGVGGGEGNTVVLFDPCRTCTSRKP